MSESRSLARSSQNHALPIVRRLSRTLLALALTFGLGSPIAMAAQKPAKSYTIATPPEPNYSQFDWLLGEWTGKTNGKKAPGQVLLSVSYELGKRFMTFREQLALPPVGDTPATHEGLMGILHTTAAGGFELTMYSSNGFISHYQVAVKHGEIDFTPAGGPLPPPGWLFRRIFKHTNPGECTETVEVAPPQGAFFKYYTAELTQVTPAVTSQPKAAPKGSPADGIVPGPGE